MLKFRNSALFKIEIYTQHCSYLVRILFVSCSCLVRFPNKAPSFYYRLTILYRFSFSYLKICPESKFTSSLFIVFNFRLFSILSSTSLPSFCSSWSFLKYFPLIKSLFFYLHFSLSLSHFTSFYHFIISFTFPFPQNISLYYNTFSLSFLFFF